MSFSTTFDLLDRSPKTRSLQQITPAKHFSVEPGFVVLEYRAGTLARRLSAGAHRRRGNAGYTSVDLRERRSDCAAGGVDRRRHMAIYKQELHGDIDQFVEHLKRQILSGGVSASLEDTSDMTLGDARTVVLVFERYSAFGSNRVSLAVTIPAVGDQISVTAITSGGSQAVFWKLNTVGEESFLDRARRAIESWA